MNESIFEHGNIILIQDYEFDDGSSKDKIAIILKVIDGQNAIIQSLTTSKDYVPDNKLYHGCTNSSNGLFSFYLFLADRIIAENGFSFNKNTFIYFRENVSIQQITSFLKYSLTDIRILGKLTQSEYQRLMKCLKSSKFVKKSILVLLD